MRLVHGMTRAPQDIDAAFIEGLHADGLDTDALASAASVAWRFALINRAADAFDFPLGDEATQRRITWVLGFMGRRAGGGAAPAPTVSDGAARPAELQAAWEHLRSVPGFIDPSLRSDIEAYAAGLWGAVRPSVSLDPVLQGYVGRVAAYAWGLDDAATEDLRSEGYDDEQIFEITVAAAFGAAMAGIEAVYGADPTRSQIQ